ncbi:hypothetical protein [Zhihengliuella sp.]|uniref:hypothetical protein n=1 Tax=Zhihengliuella sp. TaxID=1954483 RepID=UPI0028119971|nr:hypothetical protein [Zhihengliuella sp.]
MRFSAAPLYEKLKQDGELNIGPISGDRNASSFEMECDDVLALVVSGDLSHNPHESQTSMIVGFEYGHHIKGVSIPDKSAYIYGWFSGVVGRMVPEGFGKPESEEYLQFLLDDLLEKGYSDRITDSSESCLTLGFSSRELMVEVQDKSLVVIAVKSEIKFGLPFHLNSQSTSWVLGMLDGLTGYESVDE